MILSESDVNTIRNDHPHVSRFYLSIFQPLQVYCGTISGTPDRGARELTLVDVSGSIVSLSEGMTLYIGTEEGGKTISKRRYRKRSGNTITLDENTVEWAAGMYVTAYNYYELWPVYPFITSTSPFTFYKDRDVTYVDQNDNIPPVAIGGGPYVGFLDGGLASFDISALSSYAVSPGATITGYLWECAEGYLDDANAAETTLTFDTAYPGGCYLHLTVTDSNSKTQKLHIPVFVHDRSGANSPISQFGISSDLSGDYNSGGYSMGIDIWDKDVVDVIFDTPYCVFWSEDYYDGIEHEYNLRGKVRFAGYGVNENINRSYKAGIFSLTLTTINGLLEELSMTSISMEEGSISNWYTFPIGTLTVGRALHHLWRWHSTLFSIADVILPMSVTTRLPACDDFEKGSLYSTADNFANTYSIFAKVCCDCAGRIIVERNINTLGTAQRGAIDTVMTLTAADRMYDDDVSFVKNDRQISCVLLSGVAYDAGEDDYVPILSSCPGGLYADIGVNTMDVERQALDDQTSANVLSGRLLAIMNQSVTEVNMSLAGNYPVELVPQNWYMLADMDTLREDIDLENAKAVCRRISYKIDMSAGTISPSVSFEPEALSVVGDGEKVDPPEDPNSGTPAPYTPAPISNPNPPTRGYFNFSIILQPAAGLAGYIEVPFNCIVQSVKLVADAAGSAEVDIWKSTYADFPPTVDDSIVGSTPPTLSSEVKMTDVALTGWTKTWARGSWLAFYINSISGIGTLTISISGYGY